MTLKLANIKRIAVFDDEPGMQQLICEQIEDIDLEPVVIPPPENVRDIYKIIKGKADSAIFDHRLNKAGYVTTYKGANAVAELIPKQIPSILLTQWITTDLNTDIRPLRKQIPVLIEKDKLDGDALLRGLEYVIAEMLGQPKASRVSYQTLIRVEAVVEVAGEKYVDVIVPGWNPSEGVRFPVSYIPIDIHQYIKEGERFHAKVNTGAEDASELFFETFELIEK